MTITFRAKTNEGFTIDSPLAGFFFPDGAAHIKGAETLDPEKYQYQIADVRGLDHNDFFTLAMWADTCDYFGQDKVVLLPYLPGARADRGIPFGASVYGDFLSGLFIDQIITLDPHSPVAPKSISNPDHFGGKGNNVTVFPFERIIKREIQSVESDERPQPYVGVIAPDKGAVGRASQAAKVMGVPVCRGEKSRDFETGKLTGFHMIDELPDQGRLLIVDDICDGGGTFMGLAEAAGLGPDRIDLWVTHGVFSKGFKDLAAHFGVIHTTDSYCQVPQHSFRTDIDDSQLQVHPILPYLTEAISV